MNQTASIQQLGTKNEAREQLKLQIAQHLAQQPESTQAAHKWMMRLEAAWAGLVVAEFIVAMYLSIAWESVPPTMIAVAWFIFAASGALSSLFLGLDAIILRAFPTVVWPGKPSKFVTGNGAVWIGLGFVLLALVVAAFWGFFAYAVGTLSFALIVPLANIFGVTLGVGIAVSIVFKMVQDLVRAITRSR
jgi:hypothetical protein